MASANDLALLDEGELASRLGDARRELFNLRFQLATGQLDNPARVGQVRHDVARILTVLRGREILEAEGTYVEPTVAEHEGALANLAAEDAAVAAKAVASKAAAEAGEHDHDHVHEDELDHVHEDELDEDEEEEEA